MKRWLVSVGLLGVLALAVAACGGEASSESEAPAAGSASDAEAGVSDVGPAAVETTGAADDNTTGDAGASDKKAKKKAKEKAKKKARQVAVALGAPKEFDLVPAKAKVKAGKVTFRLKNTGSIEHEMVVIRTDLDSAELPTDENGAAVEHGAVAPHDAGQDDGVEHEGAHVGTHVPASDGATLTLQLEPGTYALVCNLPGHYSSGMHANFTVAA